MDSVIFADQFHPTKFNTKWIFCRSPAKVQKFILPVTDFFMLDVRVRVRVWVRI